MENNNNSKEIMNILTEFLVTRIDDKILQGISYIILSKTSNSEEIEKLNAVRARLTELGVADNEYLRKIDVNTAVIFELDLQSAVDITARLSQAVGANEATDFGISKQSFERRNEDIARLVKLCVKKTQAGIDTFDICLFSKNKVPVINLTGKDKQTGQNLAISYDAFALRHTDIQDVNKQLMTQRIKINNLVLHEAVPSMTGVRTTIRLAIIR